MATSSTAAIGGGVLHLPVVRPAQRLEQTERASRYRGSIRGSVVPPSNTIERAVVSPPLAQVQNAADAHQTRSRAVTEHTQSVPAALPDTRPSATNSSTNTDTHSASVTYEEERVFMASDAPKGGGGTGPAWIGSVLAGAVVFVLVVAGVIMFANWVLGKPGTDGKVVTIYDNSPTEYRIIKPDGSTVVTGRPPAGLAGTTGRSSSGRVPSPEDVERAATHYPTRTPVPCIEGYVRNEVTRMCDLSKWVPN